MAGPARGDGGRRRGGGTGRPAQGGWPDRYRIIEDRRPAFVRAEDRKLRRPVVIRSRPRAARPGALRSEIFVLERAARNNPNVPRVLDRWADGDQEHLVLDYVAGTPLDQLISQGVASGKPYFAPALCHRMTLGLIKGLHALHRNGICHGDLKPANLIVGRGNRLVMIDFGSAWSGAAARGTRDRGSEGYAAPEQWAEEALVDARADQFSVTAILYQLLTNELPWDGLGSSVVTHLPGKVPAPTLPSRHPAVRARPGVALPALDPVVERGLALDKDRRFETTTAWLRAFEAAGESAHERKNDLIGNALRQLLARLRGRAR